MHEQIDLAFVANLVSMLRAEVDGAIWLIDDEEEGRFYQRCAHVKARVVTAPGVALKVLEVVESRGVDGVIACVRGPGVVTRRADNIFSPSTGDIASLLLASESCDSVIEDVCGKPWITASDKQFGPIRRRAGRIARNLCELHSRYPSLFPAQLSDLRKAIDWDSFDINWGELRTFLINERQSLTEFDEIRARAADVNKSGPEAIYCDGKNTVRILAAATYLFRPRGIAAHRAVEAAELMAMFRVPFHLCEFEEDEEFWRMREWASHNSCYPLLRDWRDLDPLGVVWDQRYWEIDLSRIVRLMRSNDELAVFKMDLDNFKSVNEALGHTAGDDAIRLYGSIVRDCIGTAGGVYRRGGDEIVVLAPGLGPAGARVLAETIRNQIQSAFKRWGEQRGLGTFPTASIGVVSVVAGCTGEAVVRMMDDAQRNAKQQGKNRVVLLPDEVRL